MARKVSRDCVRPALSAPKALRLCKYGACESLGGFTLLQRRMDFAPDVSARSFTKAMRLWSRAGLAGRWSSSPPMERKFQKAPKAHTVCSFVLPATSLAKRAPFRGGICVRASCLPLQRRMAFAFSCAQNAVTKSMRLWSMCAGGTPTSRAAVRCQSYRSANPMRPWSWLASNRRRGHRRSAQAKYPPRRSTPARYLGVVHLSAMERRGGKRRQRATEKRGPPCTTSA